MAVSERQISMTAQWALNANVNIPVPPVPGQAYRNDRLSAAAIEQGQRYSAIADSAEWNQLHYLLTGLAQLVERYGLMPYSKLTDYLTGSIVLGLDETAYQAIQASGPNTPGGVQPTSNTAYWKKAFSIYSGSNSISLANNVISAILAPGGGLGVGSTGLFVDPTAFAGDILNELLAVLRLPKWLEQHTNFYVRQDGDNNNNGLTNSPTGAFRTIQYAVNHIAANYTLQQYNATINLGTGTWTETVTLPKYNANTGIIIIRGGTGVGWKTDNTSILLASRAAGVYRIQDIAFEHTVSLPASGTRGLIRALGGSQIQLYNCSIIVNEVSIANAPATAVLLGEDGGHIYLGPTVIITANGRTDGSRLYPLYGLSGGQVYLNDVLTVNGLAMALLHLISVSIFARNVTNNSAIAGTFVGYRFRATSNSIVNTQGELREFFPGTIEGTLTTGAQFL